MQHQPMFCNNNDDEENRTKNNDIDNPNPTTTLYYYQYKIIITNWKNCYDEFDRRRKYNLFTTV